VSKSWTLPVEVDPETGDHYITLNDEILEGSGFKIGDTLDWRDLGDGTWALTKKAEEMKTYLVETVSIFRHRYAIRAHSLEHAYDSVVMKEVDELSQKHIDENIVGGREITEKEYLEIFDQDNDYLQSWTDEQKLKQIHTIDYEDQ